MKQKKEITITIELDDVISVLAEKYPELKQEGFLTRSVHGFRDPFGGIAAINGPSANYVEFSLIDNESYAEYEEQSKKFSTQHEDLKAQVDRIESLLVKQ